MITTNFAAFIARVYLSIVLACFGGEFNPPTVPDGYFTDDYVYVEEVGEVQCADPEKQEQAEQLDNAWQVAFDFYTNGWLSEDAYDVVYAYFEDMFC